MAEEILLTIVAAFVGGVLGALIVKFLSLL